MGFKQFIMLPVFVFASGFASAEGLDVMGGITDFFQSIGKNQANSNANASYKLPDGTAMYIRVNKGLRSDWNPEGQSLTVFMINKRGRLKPVESWDVSTGRERWETPIEGDAYFSHTPTGRFNPTWLDYDHHSTLWDAEMPRAVFFDGGVALHCTVPSHYDALGTRDSGACVRQHCDNGSRLYDWVEQTINDYGKKSVVIDVFNPDQDEEAELIARRASGPPKKKKK